MIQAYNAYLACPEKESDISEIIEKDSWLRFDRVSAYYMDGGYAKDILDYDMKFIGAIHIDDVSEQIGEEFSMLTDIIYG